MQKEKQKKEATPMIDPKHLIAQVVNETVKWAMITLAVSVSVGALVGFLLSLYFR